MLRKILFALYALTIVCMGAATFIEKDKGTPYVGEHIYGAWWFTALWAALTAAGILYIIRCRMRRPAAVAVHLSFAVILLGISCTNFCNSVVLGLVLTPVLLAMCNAFGMNAGPLMACFIYAVLIAACTPAASPFAAMLFGNTRWLSPKEIVTYSVSSSLIIAGVVIVVGIPLAMLIF